MLIAGMDPGKVYAMSRDGKTSELKVDEEVFLWGPSEDEMAAREALYKDIHEAMHISCFLPPKKWNAPNAKSPSLDASWKPTNLQRASIPDFPETQVLGHCVDGLQGWHGLTGELRVGGAWWEMTRPNWHHDGGFSGVSPPPPLLISMYCEEAPRRGGSPVSGRSA